MTAAHDWYRAFHGVSPRWSVEARRDPQWFADMGPAVAVTYLRPTSRGVELRTHPFKPESRPMLARDDGGSLHFLGGNYTVSEFGIMDQSRAMTRTDYNDPRRGMVPVSATAGVRYTPQGVPVHGRQVPREGVVVPRANPVSMVELREGGRRVLDAGVIGTTALVSVAVSDALVENTSWSEGARGWVQLAGLGLPGVVLTMTRARSVGVGLVAGGVSGAGLRWMRAAQIDRKIAAWYRKMFRSSSTGQTGGALWDEGGMDARVEAIQG